VLCLFISQSNREIKTKKKGNMIETGVGDFLKDQQPPQKSAERVTRQHDAHLVVESEKPVPESALFHLVKASKNIILHGLLAKDELERIETELRSGKSEGEFDSMKFTARRTVDYKTRLTDGVEIEIKKHGVYGDFFTTVVKVSGSVSEHTSYGASRVSDGYAIADTSSQGRSTISFLEGEVDQQIVMNYSVNASITRSHKYQRDNIMLDDSARIREAMTGI